MKNTILEILALRRYTKINKIHKKSDLAKEQKSKFLF